MKHEIKLRLYDDIGDGNRLSVRCSCGVRFGGATWCGTSKADIASEILRSIRANASAVMAHLMEHKVPPPPDDTQNKALKLERIIRRIYAEQTNALENASAPTQGVDTGQT